jgi:hypothetical protein
MSSVSQMFSKQNGHHRSVLATHVMASERSGLHLRRQAAGPTTARLRSVARDDTQRPLADGAGAVRRHARETLFREEWACAFKAGNAAYRLRLQGHRTQAKMRHRGYEVPIAAVYIVQPGLCGAHQMQRVGGSQEDIRRQRGHALRLCIDE